MMKTTIERLGDTQLRLDVEVPEDVFAQAFDQTLVMMGRELNVPGFRPGKVPAKAVLARLGREAVAGETVRMFLDDWYRAAVVASGIRPVAQPDVEFAEDAAIGTGPVKFSATVEVAPKPTLPELSTLEVDKPNLPDTQKYVDQVLEQTLRGAGKLVDTGKAAVEGDEVVVDFRCTVDGENVSGAGASGYQAKLGDGRLLGELEQAILGEKAGADLEIPVTFPVDHPMSELAGKDAMFHLKLSSVQNVDMPELSDEIAKQVSEFTTADALVEDIRSSITERLEQEVAGIFRGNAVAALANAAEFEVPEALVQARQQEMYGGLKQQLGQSGLTIEQYLDRSGQDSDSLFAELEEGARDDVRRELSLLALAEDAKVEVTEEDLRKEIAEHAEHTGRPVEETTKQIFESGRADMLRGELLIQRTIDHLVATVKAKAVDLPTADEAAAEAEAKNEVPA